MIFATNSHKILGKNMWGGVMRLRSHRTWEVEPESRTQGPLPHIETARCLQTASAQEAFFHSPLILLVLTRPPRSSLHPSSARRLGWPPQPAPRSVFLHQGSQPCSFGCLFYDFFFALSKPYCYLQKMFFKQIPSKNNNNPNTLF